jgi:hypothetical protein
VQHLACSPTSKKEMGKKEKIPSGKKKKEKKEKN